MTSPAIYPANEWAADESRFSGLTFAFKGGVAPRSDHLGFDRVGGGTLSLADNAIRFIERTDYGVVTASSGTWFSVDKIPMARVVTAGGVIFDVKDFRVPLYLDVTPTPSTRGEPITRHGGVSGAADASTALRAACAAAMVAGVMAVHLPAGQWNFPAATGTADIIPSNFTIDGAGIGVTTVRATGLTSGNALFSLSRRKNVRIRHMTLSAPTLTAGTFGWQPVAGEDCTLEHCRILAEFGWGVIFSQQSERCGVVGCLVLGTTSGNAIEVNGGLRNFVRKTYARDSVVNLIESYHMSGLPHEENEFSDLLLRDSGNHGVDCLGAVGDVYRRITTIGSFGSGMRISPSETEPTHDTENGTVEDFLAIGAGSGSTGPSIACNGLGWTFRRVRSHKQVTGTAIAVGKGAHTFEDTEIYECQIMAILVDVAAQDGTTFTRGRIHNPSASGAGQDAISSARQIVVEDFVFTDDREPRLMSRWVNLTGGTGSRLEGLSGVPGTAGRVTGGTATIYRNIDGVADQN
ncbi:MAG TPA: hypothetical protein VFZ21_07415 [Gemmatimonadaceae bacterium]|nr:hypothetical protein [Gemmatimonadaceae bacterium]